MMMMMSSTLHVMPVFHCLLAVRPDCQIADFFFCCAPINISILCAIQCCTLDILPIYLTCSLTNVCLCVFVLAIPTTTPPVTTGRPKYCGTVPTVVSWRCWLLFFCVLWRYATACGRRPAACVKLRVVQTTEKWFILIILCHLSEQYREKVSSKLSSFCRHGFKMYLFKKYRAYIII